MVIFKGIILLIFVALTLQQTLIAQAICKGKPKFLNINFALAQYGPAPYFHQSQLYSSDSIPFLCEDIKDTQVTNFFKNKSVKKTLLIQRGKASSKSSCKFEQKTIAAQNLGADMAIIYDNIEDSFVTPAASGSYSTNIKIPTLSITLNDGVMLKELYKQCQSVLIKVQYNRTATYQSIRQLSLPLVHFDISNAYQMQFLSDFYQHQFYDSFINQIQIKHIILYHNNNCSSGICNSSTDCQEYSFKNNRRNQLKTLCYKPNEFFTGKQILKEQMRSYSIFQILGQKKWFVYRQLFYNNMCHFNEQIDECVAKTFNELQITAQNIKAITQYMKHFENLDTSQKIDDKVDVVKVYPERLTVYSSQIYSVYWKLCNWALRQPLQCKYLKKQPIYRKISQFKPTYLNFIQPQLLINKDKRQIIQIQINDQILPMLQELVIILTPNPSTFNPIERNNQIFPKPVFTSYKIMGQFGLRTQFKDNNVEFISKMDQNYNQYIIIKKKQLINNKLTIFLKFGLCPHYSLMINPKSTDFLLKENVFDTTIIEDGGTITYPIKFEFTQSKQIDSFVILTNFKRSYYSFSYNYSILGRIDQNKTEYQDVTSQFILFYQPYQESPTTFTFNPSKVYSSKLSRFCRNLFQNYVQNKISCNYILKIKNKESKVQVLRINVLKIAKADIYPMDTKTTLKLYFPYYIQKINVNNYQNRKTIKHFQITSTTKLRNINYKHQYRQLKIGQQQIKTMAKWEENIENTQLLYHEQNNTNGTYTSTLRMNHPYNIPKRYQKINNITIYLIYKIVQPTVSQVFQLTQTLRILPSKQSISYSFAPVNVIFDGKNYMKFLTGKSITYATKNKAGSTFNMLFKQSSNKNLRIFTNIYYLPRQQSYALTSMVDFSNHSYNLLTKKYNHKETQRIYKVNQSSLDYQIYQVFDSIYGYLPKFVQVYVEIINKTISLPKGPLFSLGSIVTQMTTQLVSLTSYNVGLIQVNPLLNYKNYYIQISAPKQLLILNLQSIIERYTQNINICIYKYLGNYAFTSSNPAFQYCFSYNSPNLKYWKDLETDKIIRGIKIVEPQQKLIQLQLPYEKLTQLSTLQAFYQEYGVKEKSFNNNKLNMYVKIKVQNFNKIVQIKDYTEQLVNQTNKNNNQQQLIKENKIKIENLIKNKNNSTNNRSEQVKLPEKKKEQTVPPITPEKKKEQTVTPIAPETKKEQTVPPITPETKEEQTVPPITPETKKEQTVPPITPEKKKEQTVTPIAPETKKEQTVPIAPETKKEQTVPPITPEKKKEQTVPIAPETKKEQTLSPIPKEQAKLPEKKKEQTSTPQVKLPQIKKDTQANINIYSSHIENEYNLHVDNTKTQQNNQLSYQQKLKSLQIKQNSLQNNQKSQLSNHKYEQTQQLLIYVIVFVVCLLVVILIILLLLNFKIYTIIQHRIPEVSSLSQFSEITSKSKDSSSQIS